MKEKVKSLAKEISNWVIDIRHHLHANPELSFEEHHTSIYIQSILHQLDVAFETGYVKTGIVATIKCNNPDLRNIALRADMDALPITETNTCLYASKNKGVMHACGHDAHSAALLGVINIINQLKHELVGTYTFIFQPAEEKLPGGASLMINEGLFEKHPIDVIFGQHVTPQIDTGKVGFREGMFMASTDEIYIEVMGKGGHAAMPHLYNNPLLIASELLLRLNHEFSDEMLKSLSIEIPTVLAFGFIEGKGATNVVPDTVKLQGTFRTFDEDWRTKAHLRINDICGDIAQKSNATIHCNIIKGYPFLTNDPVLTRKSIIHAQEFLGHENVINLEPRMTAEDFAFYSQVKPACFYRIGTGNDSIGTRNNVHTSNFDIDENSLEVMVGLMCYLAIQD
jgi:amidohydrolase